MSDLLSTSDLTAPAIEPAKSWENRFRVRVNAMIAGALYRPGDLLIVDGIPSRDIAETEAHEWLAEPALDGEGLVSDVVEYLGAFPERGAP